MWPIPLEGPTLLKHTATVFPHNTQSREGIPFPRVILNIMCLRLNFKNQQIKLPSQDALIHSHSFKRELGCLWFALYPMKGLSNFLSTAFLQSVVTE